MIEVSPLHTLFLLSIPPPIPKIMSKKHTIILYPFSSTSHLISMVELAKLITKHHPSFSITVLVTIPPSDTTGVSSTSSYIDRVSKTTPSITFHYLPTISLPTTTTKDEELMELRRLNDHLVHNALQSISSSTVISAFILSVFLSTSLQLTHQLNIPTFCFFPSGVSILSILLHLPTVHKNTTQSFKDMNTLLHFPGVPPIHSCDMIKPLLDRTAKVYQAFLEYATHLRKSQGIIVNSFEYLEPSSLKAVSNGLCIPDGPTPTVYCVGPLTASDDRTAKSGDSGQVSCLKWLDEQPRNSVVFLCFGSQGAFSEKQLKEIAIGLEKSGQRFLWVVRHPPNDDPTTIPSSAPQDPDRDLDLGTLLPDGFLERTKERGLVVKSWAPQVEVLSRESVGGFVTHCGWNSVLEALCAGVPMVAWPLYAEQRVNRVILVEELRLALPMDENADGFVWAAEVEQKVRGVMESEEGRVIRERIMEFNSEAKAAISEGGSSIRALGDLAKQLK